MNNLSQKSVDLLTHINEELGIDIAKYEDGEKTDKITGQLTNQNHALSSLYKPILVSLAIFIIGFFGLSMETVGYTIYGFFGFIAFVLIGIIYGIIKLLASLKNDLLSITNLALDRTKCMMGDLNHLNNTLRDDIKNPIGLVFEGAIAAYIKPYILNKYNRIPVAGKILISGSDKVLNTVVFNLKKQEDKLDIRNRLVGTCNVAGKQSATVENFISFFSTKVDPLLNSGVRTIQLPFRIALVCLISATFIFMLYVSIF